MMGAQFALFFGLRIGCYSYSAFMNLVYEKALKLKSSGNKSVGEVKHFLMIYF